MTLGPPPLSSWIPLDWRPKGFLPRLPAEVSPPTPPRRALWDSNPLSYPSSAFMLPDCSFPPREWPDPKVLAAGC